LATKTPTNVTDIETADFVRQAMLDYGSYVLGERAVADLADGLKPVQRRILWAMYHDLKIYPNKNFRKSAKIVGETMGTYHPHGDAAIYEAMVNLVWQRYPLIDSHGNFGNLAGEPPAASRYTEARLHQNAMALFDCVAVADFENNYSDDAQEPCVLPSRLPILLVNGTAGIAPGLSTRLPQHNLTEIITALKLVLKTKQLPTIEDIFKVFHGPDHVVGGIITSDLKDIKNVYKTGNGTISYRCDYKYEQIGNDHALVIVSYAPQFNVEGFIARCSALVEAGQLLYITDESSDKNGVRIVVGFKNSGVLRSEVLPQLHTFEHYNFYVLRYAEGDGSKPKLLSFIELLSSWIDYRRDIETQVLQSERGDLIVKKGKEEAKLSVIQNWSVFQQIVDTAKDEDAAVADIIAKLKLTRLQAAYILGIAIRSFLRYEEKAVQQKIADIQTEIDRVDDDLKHIDRYIEARLDELIPKTDSRLVALTKAEPQLQVKDASFFIAVNKKGSMWRVDQAPTRGRATFGHEFFVRESTMVTIVQACNIAGQFGPKWLKDGDTTYKDIIGVIPSACDCIVAVDDNGYGLCIEHPQKIDEYTFLRGSSTVTEAMGLAPQDILICYNNSKVNMTKREDLYISRRNSTGYRSVPFLTRETTCHLMVVPHKGALVDAAGAKFDLSKASHVNAIPGYKKALWCLGEENLVIWSTGQREIASLADVIKAMRGGHIVASIFPLR